MGFIGKVIVVVVGLSVLSAGGMISIDQYKKYVEKTKKVIEAVQS